MKISAKAMEMARLRDLFYRHPRQEEFEKLFNRLLEKRRAEIANGFRAEGRGIAVVGAAGSGKSIAVKRLFEKNSSAKMMEEGCLEADVVSLDVPSPATLKEVGITLLKALGYDLKTDRSAGIIWGLVSEHLALRKILFLHLDEAQHLSSAKSELARQSVINTLKSVMQKRGWPVGIILSGTPEVSEILNFDPQLSRRFYPIEFRPLHYSSDREIVQDLLVSYVRKASLSLSKETLTEDFGQRLSHSGANELGLIIQLVTEAIETASEEDSSVLEHRHFSAAFRLKAGCMDGLNPFIADDYLTIDSRRLFDRGNDNEGLYRPWYRLANCQARRL